MNKINEKQFSGFLKPARSEKNCRLCLAEFEVWLSTLNFAPEREEKLRNKSFIYCPACKMES